MYISPLNAQTQIRYSISVKESVPVTLRIYNLLGEEVRKLNGGRVTTGEYILTWDGKDLYERPLPSGVYVYRLQVGDISAMNKALLLK